MINLERLQREKETFRYFALHLSYPEYVEALLEMPFGRYIPPPHPGYAHVRQYEENMKDRDLFQRQMLYTETFDFQQDTTLYMTYVKFADSKERGQMLARLKVLYEMFGLMMPDGELSDFLPLMCEFIYVADWQGDHRALESFSLLFAVIEDGTYHLLNALEKYESPYAPLIKGLRETCKACIVRREEAQMND